MNLRRHVLSEELEQLPEAESGWPRHRTAELGYTYRPCPGYPCMPPSSHAINVHRVRGASTDVADDWVAAEEPLEIRLGYSVPGGRTAASVSITMRTPGNDEELATGFLYSEGIISHVDDLAEVAHCGAPAPDSGNRNVVRVDLAADVNVDIERLKRHFYTTSSCGVCGKSSLDALSAVGVEPLADGGFTIGSERLTGLPEKLRAMQITFDRTGGLHAAAVFNSQGEILLTREDVGRHNAVDKAVGTLLQDGRLPASDLGLLVSGRASFELVQKALVAGIPLLAAVSAPSSLAVRLANEFNVSLIGFLRGENYNVYSGRDRIHQ